MPSFNTRKAKSRRGGVTPFTVIWLIMLALAICNLWIYRGYFLKVGGNILPETAVEEDAQPLQQNLGKPYTSWNDPKHQKAKALAMQNSKPGTRELQGRAADWKVRLKEKVEAHKTEIENSKARPNKNNIQSYPGTRSNKATVMNRRSDGRYQFFEFDWNVGRVNNQLLSLEAAMGYAKFYKRVLVIPGPQGVGRGLDNQFMGFRSGMWDLEYLSDYFDWIFQEDLHKLPGIKETPQSCFISGVAKRSISWFKQENCVVLYLSSSKLGIFKFDQEAYGLVSYLKPSQYIRDMADYFIKTKFGGVLPEVGVHNRMMKEGGVELDQVYLCRQSKYSAHGNFGRDIKKIVTDFYKDPKSSWDTMQAYYLSCAFNSSDLEFVLKQHGRTTPEKYFLATDNQDEKRTKDLERHGAVRITEQDFEKVSKWAEHETWLHNHDCERVNCFNKRYIIAIEFALVDMWILRSVSYFVGSWASTFTQNLCKWRGVERRHNSTLCSVERRWREALNTGVYL